MKQALQIATIYKSKGLEYDVVFCPVFAEGKAELRDDHSVFFHEPAGNQRPLAALDLGSGAVRRKQSDCGHARTARRANPPALRGTHSRPAPVAFRLGEILRAARLSAANWVLHPARADGDSATMIANIKALSDSARRAELEALAARAPGAISVIDLPSEIAPALRVLQQTASERSRRPRISRPDHARLAHLQFLLAHPGTRRRAARSRSCGCPIHAVKSRVRRRSGRKQKASTHFHAAKKLALASTKSLKNSTFQRLGTSKK